MDLWVPCSTRVLLPRGECLPRPGRTQAAEAGDVPCLSHAVHRSAGLGGSHSWPLSTEHCHPATPHSGAIPHATSQNPGWQTLLSPFSCQCHSHTAPEDRAG